MATIKDVAKKAGVSLATVSNVINGKKTVQSKYVKAVEKAMAELEYVPNARAQGLKKNRSKEFAIVLPNIHETDYAEIYSGFQRQAAENGYITSLFSTNYSKEHEREILYHIICQQFYGVAIVSCIPTDEDIYLQLEHAGIKVVFLLNETQNMHNACYIGIDYSRIFKRLIHVLKEKCGPEIVMLCGQEAYSNEGAIKNLFIENMMREGLAVSQNSVYMVEPNDDNGFRAVLQWLDRIHKPNVIIASKYEYVSSAISAINFRNSRKKVFIVAFDKDDMLFSQNSDTTLRIPIEYSAVGSRAAKMLVSFAQSSKNREVKSILLPCSSKAIAEVNNLFSRTDDSETVVQTYHGTPLRLLLLKSASAQAIRKMIHVFEKISGIRVELQLVDYQQLYNASVNSMRNGESDIVSICNAWLREFVQNGLISQMETNSSAFSVFKKQFPKAMQDSYSTVDSALYALPYSLDAQLLFYRKDLFENLKLRRMFYEKYKYELLPPQDLNSYLDTAEFFTRSCNGESPTLYGTSMVGRGVNSIYEIMPIFWDIGGSFFDEKGKLESNEKRFAEALKIYRRLMEYSSNEAREWESWAQKAQSFCSGSTAMMPLYQAHFMDEYSPFDSAVGNKVGVCKIPFKHSVLGGWCLSIPQMSPSRKEAMQFLQWLYMDKNVIIHNMLGGSIPTRYALKYSDLNSKTEWMNFVLEQLDNTSYMLAPNERTLNQWKFETEIYQALDAFVQDLIGADETSYFVFSKLKKMSGK